MEKLTLREQFEGLKQLVLGQETEFTAEQAVEFIEGRIAQLDKKAGKGAGKAKARTAEEQAFDQAVLEVVTEKGQATVKAIREVLIETGKADAGVTSQKVTGAVRVLEKAGLVKQITVEKVKGKVVILA